MKVVRCPGCRGASRVAPEAIGQTVACPRCHEPFLAIEEAAPFTPPSPSPPSSPRPRLRPRRPQPPTDDDRPRRQSAVPVGPPSDPHAVHHHSHNAEPAGKLPATVLIGLALLPFVVPLLWTIAPLVVGQPPMLSLATPIALAVGASALCLAVVYTVDWSPITRVKGVLMLVGLSYFAGLSLYFLKREMVEKARSFVGETRSWDTFKPPGGEYKVWMPPKPSSSPDHRPLAGWDLKNYRASHNSFGGQVTFTVGMATDPKPAIEGDYDAWFNEVEKAFGAGKATADIKPLQPLPSTGPGRQYEFRQGQTTRVIRIYRAKGRLYYLSVEGRNVDADDSIVKDFFDSFFVVQE